MENCFPIPQKPKYTIISSSTPRCISKRIENRHSNPCTQMFRASLITLAKRLETTQISTSIWMDKQIVVLTYNEIFFSHKKEWSTGKYYNVDEPQKHLCQVKETRHKRSSSVLFHLYETFRISQSIERLVMVNDRGRGEARSNLLNGLGVLFCSHENVFELGKGDGGKTLQMY